MEHLWEHIRVINNVIANPATNAQSYLLPSDWEYIMIGRRNDTKKKLNMMHQYLQ